MGHTEAHVHVFNQKSTIYYTCIFCRKISLNYESGKGKNDNFAKSM